MVKDTTTDCNGYVNETLGNCQLDFDSLYELYMKLSKEDLARLLATKDLAQRSGGFGYPVYPSYPTYPYPPQYPWITWYTTTC